jgi:beta-glucosidase
MILPVGSAMQSPEFIFGVATSSFQIEGAVEHRLPSIWDTFCARPGAIRDQSDGKVACDHYAKWREDVDLLSRLCVDAYRFSISWPRVIGQDGSLNADGIGFYLRILDRLNDKGIKPFVTLYHWDLPQHLQDGGGWLNRETAHRFCDYVDRVTRAFDSRVYSYATLNEPYCSAYLGYEKGVHAPGFTNAAMAKQAAHNLLLAHGMAMQVLERNSPDSENGIVLNFAPCYPATDSDADRAAAAAADAEFNQWYLQPILEGRYPDLFHSLPEQEVPEMQDGDLDVISHPIDYLGVNYYTRNVYRAGSRRPYIHVAPSDTLLTEMGWEIFPQGLTELLLSLEGKYDLPPVYITENGAAMRDTPEQGRVEDEDRTRYLQQHLEALDEAMRQGVDVRGYFAWSLMDNFEWAEGYTKRFGLVYVDYATQHRTVKASGAMFREMLARRRHAGG